VFFSEHSVLLHCNVASIYFHPELQQNAVHSGKLAKAQNKHKLTKAATRFSRTQQT